MKTPENTKPWAFSQGPPKHQLMFLVRNIQCQFNEHDFTLSKKLFKYEEDILQKIMIQKIVVD